VTFGLATALVVPHCDSTRPGEAAFAVYEGATSPPRFIHKKSVLSP
jgi:hypothetical protein